MGDDDDNGDGPTAVRGLIIDSEKLKGRVVREKKLQNFGQIRTGERKTFFGAGVR